MGNIVAYCRVSTDKDDQLNSLQAQKQFFEDYCRQNGQTLLRIYADEGISGTRLNKREQFLQLMDDAGALAFDTLIVKDISRFARNTVDFLQSIRTLKALGIQTVFLTSNQTILGDSEFILTIFGALAQEESANTSKRVKFGKGVNAAKGRVPNLVYGYDKTKGDYFHLAVNEREASVVRQIFRLYVYEELGAHRIAKILNSQGLLTKRGYRWSQNAVVRILSNPLYSGKVINGKSEVTDFLTGTRKKKKPDDWIVVERPELCIIKQEEFQQAQALLAMRSHSGTETKTRRPAAGHHTFSSLIRCKSCGHTFRRLETTYKNTYVRWVCSQRNLAGADTCSNKVRLDERDLLQALQDYLSSYLEEPGLLNEVAAACSQKIREKGHTANAASGKERLAKLARQREKYLALYEDDLITLEDVKQKLRAIQQEAGQLELAVHGALSKQGPLHLQKILQAAFPTTSCLLKIAALTNRQMRELVNMVTVSESGEVAFFLAPLHHN